MTHRLIELFKIWFALLLTNLTPSRLHTRLCRFIYPYNAQSIKGFDWIIDYRPLDGLERLKILINTKEFVGWNILFRRHYEQDTNLLLQRFIRPGMITVEAGAHIGSETLLMAAMVGAHGKVYAFEPNPVVKKRLDINIRFNRFEQRIISSGTALGESNGTVSFYVKEEHIPNQGLSSKYKFDEDVTQIEVTQQTLDDWFVSNGVERIDFLKMDVQGAEIDILKGGSEVITRFRPAIFAEAAPSTQSDSRQSLEDLYDILSVYGYRVYHIGKNGELQPITKSSLTIGNWLAIHSEENGNRRV